MDIIHKAKISLIFILVLYSLSVNSQDSFHVRVFDSRLPIPMSYLVNPRGYGEHTKVRLMNLGNTNFSWVEVTVATIGFCGSGCHKSFLCSYGKPSTSGETKGGVSWLKHVPSNSQGETVFYFFDEENVVKILNDSKLAKKWIDILNKEKIDEG